MDNAVKVAIIAGVFGIIGAFIAHPDIITSLSENQPLVISNLTSTPYSPQVDGTPITWTAIASGRDKDAIKYQFELNSPYTRKQWVVQQNWSLKGEWIWNSTYSDIGNDNYIRVSIKDAEHESPISKQSTYSITNSGVGEIIHTNYTNMKFGETYPFMACIALDDSIGNAKNDIKEFTNASDESIITSNDSNEAAKRNPETPIIAKTSFKVAKDTDVVVDLIEKTPGTFTISHVDPKDNPPKPIAIPQDEPGHNYASWIFDVMPISLGSHELILSVKDGKNHNRVTLIPIKVIVNQERENAAEEGAAKAAQNAAAVVKENVTTTITITNAPAENVTTTTVPTENVTTTTTITNAPAENVTTTTTTVPSENATTTTTKTTAPAENNTTATTNATKKTTPGFESIFALTGLLAVAYLVLSRRE